MKTFKKLKKVLTANMKAILKNDAFNEVKVTDFTR